MLAVVSVSSVLIVWVGDEGSEGVRVCGRGSVRVCESPTTAPFVLNNVLSLYLSLAGERRILFAMGAGVR